MFCHDPEVMIQTLVGSNSGVRSLSVKVGLQPKIKSLQELLTIDCNVFLEQIFTTLTTVSY